MKKFILVLALGLSSLVANAEVISINANQQSELISIQQKQTDYLSYYFGRVWINTSRSVTYELKNNGPTFLQIHDISLVGVFFYGNSNCPNTLAPGATCTTTVNYWPGTDGYHSARLVWETSANDIVVNLWGEGIR